MAARGSDTAFEDAGGGGGAAAADAASGGAAAAGAPAVAVPGGEVSDPLHPCAICMDREDDATVGGKVAGLCTACGKLICGECFPRVLAAVWPRLCGSCSSRSLT